MVQSVDVLWLRVRFALSAAEATAPQALYLPYLYGGGRIWLDTTPLTTITENTASTHARWERPHLLALPQTALMRGGVHELLIRASAAESPQQVQVPGLMIGPLEALQSRFATRLLLVRTLPQVTVVAGMVVGLLVMSIWLRRRKEVEYGLFGLAMLLWALRTTTFTIDVMPESLWPWWRLLYHTATGGFVATMALFALRMAGRWHPRLAWAMGAYVLSGPLVFLASGGHSDEWLGRWWVLGLIPMALAVPTLALWTAWRRRSPGTVAVAAAVALAVLAGAHDYAVAWTLPWLQTLMPGWAGERLFLLHHAANLLLLVMGTLLSTRLVKSLNAVEEANRTLEARVAAREVEISHNYEQISELKRAQAVQGERQRMVQDLHDGLGSQLFSSLMRAQRGALDGPATVETLRGAIDEMRVAIEALTPDDSDFGTAFGNFRYRWDERLKSAGLRTQWQVDLPDSVLPLPPAVTLQVLRVAQEALTNVLKHAGAAQVRVQMAWLGSRLRLEVTDDGRSASPDDPPARPAQPASPSSRGLVNMRKRAEQLGGHLEAQFGSEGGRVMLDMPVVLSGA